MIGEISYDLVMSYDMSFIEGCFRLPGKDWQVVIITRKDTDAPVIKLTEWDSGVTGVFIEFPRNQRLNAAEVERLLCSIYDIESRLTVRGPDSMLLR